MLDNIYVSHGQGGANELLCQSCYSSATTWKIVGFIIAMVVMAVMFLIFSSMFFR